MAALPSVTVLGAGRMGQGLALALRGVEILLVSRQGHPVAAPLRLYAGTRAEAVARGRVVILAVPDDAVTSLAADLSAEGSVRADHTVAGRTQPTLCFLRLLLRVPSGGFEIPLSGLGIEVQAIGRITDVAGNAAP